MDTEKKGTDYYVFDEKTGEYKLIGEMIDVVKWADANDEKVKTFCMDDVIEDHEDIRKMFEEHEKEERLIRHINIAPINTMIGGWAVLAILKLTGVIEIGWQWVMCPVWLPVFSSLLIYAIMLLWAIVSGFIDGFEEENDDV